MVKIKKCKSRKHSSGGCGNPRCPEGKSIRAAKDAAVLNKDSNSFIAAREVEESRLPFSQMRDWIKGTLFPMGQTSTPTSDLRTAPEPLSAELLERIEHIKSIDKTQLPSFTEIGALNNHLNALYAPEAYVVLYPIADNGSGLLGLAVDDMQVINKHLRGEGIGRHMRATILKFADENNYIVAGSPTMEGDGSVDSLEPGFKSHALTHRTRLEKFYLDSGYEYNYAFEPDPSYLFDPAHLHKDELTGKDYPSNPRWKEQFNSEATAMLKDSGFYVRWPNNQIPENWKAAARQTEK